MEYIVPIDWYYLAAEYFLLLSFERGCFWTPVCGAVQHEHKSALFGLPSFIMSSSGGLESKHHIQYQGIKVEAGLK